MTNDEHDPNPTPEASAAMGEMLGEVPAPTIPPDVSQRIVAAIGAESHTRIAAESTNVHALARSSRFRRLLPVAASAAAIMVLGFLIWPLIGDEDTTDTVATATACTVTADATADLSPVLHVSGVRYRDMSLVSQAEAMARQPAMSCGQPARDESRVLRDKEQDLAESPVPQSLRSDSTVRRCVVSAVSGRLVHAIDVATFNGNPAIVVVVSSPGEVFALKCGTGPTKVLARQAMTQRP